MTTRASLVRGAWVILAALALGLALAMLLSARPDPLPSPPAWPLVTRTVLTTRAGDAYLTTVVVMPEDLDHVPTTR